MAYRIIIMVMIMKKPIFYILLVPFFALSCVACDGYSGKVSKELFQRQIKKLEPHDYSYAFVEHIEKGEDNTLLGTYPDYARDFSESYNYYYDSQIGQWIDYQTGYTPNKYEVISLYKSGIPDRPKMESETEDIEIRFFKQTVIYYINPMKIVYNYSFELNGYSGGSFKIERKFDKYGYMVQEYRYISSEIPYMGSAYLKQTTNYSFD